METENIYRHLTDEEWNAISQFTADNKLDEVFDIASDENGDFFYDFELEEQIPFEDCLCDLACCIGIEGLYYPNYSKDFRDTIGEIFDKYCETEKVKRHVKSVNEMLNS